MQVSSAAQRSRTEYTQRMNRVMDYIDSHLAGDIDLAALADVAHFSPFHFHRLFAAWMGATLGDYVRRRRLEVAALQLAGNTRISVLEVALGVGFGSGEAFARAFKLRFGLLFALALDLDMAHAAVRSVNQQVGHAGQ